MKKRAYIVRICLVLLLFAACGKKEPVPEDKTTITIVTPRPTETPTEVPTAAPAEALPAQPVVVPEAKFLECLEMEHGFVVVKSEYDDFDNNGVYEMFAFVVETEWMEQNHDDMLYGKAVFLNSALELSDLTEEFYIWDDTAVRTVALPDRLLFVVDEAFPSFVLSKVYAVYDGEPEYLLGGLGYFEEGQDGEFCVTVSDYDMVVDNTGFATGHTWKKYYFYYEEETHSFREYEAVEITKEKFLEWQGAAELLKELMLKYKEPELQFLYRENGMVHVNIAYKEYEYTIQKNTSARLVDGSLTNLEENDGKYRLNCTE